MSDALAPLLAVLVACVAVPAMLMRMLAGSLESGRLVPNFRGRRVYAGLGIVWVIWAGGALISGMTVSVLDEGRTLLVLVFLGPLALVAAALGLIDDAYGSGADRGFRGHFRALRHGRVTTGMLKLMGIGSASLGVAVMFRQIAPWNAALGAIAGVAAVPLAAAAIALTANFVNLTDLRPGRALKVYTALAVVGCSLVVAATAAGFVVGVTQPSSLLLSGLALLIALLGPVVAVWRYDLGERGMLGDAGANAMGAVAGATIVLGLPLWALVLYAASMLALNAAAERISFSSVIDRTPLLRWIDRLGRLPEDEPVAVSSESPAHSPSDVGDSRYHLEDDHDTREA